MNKAAIYCRMAARKSNISEQVEKCIDYCKDKGYVVTGVYSEPTAYRRAKAPPALEQLMADMKQDEFEIVVVTEYNRLSCNSAKVIELELLFEAHKVKLETAFDYREVNQLAQSLSELERPEVNGALQSKSSG